MTKTAYKNPPLPATVFRLAAPVNSGSPDDTDVGFVLPEVGLATPEVGEATTEVTFEPAAVVVGPTKSGGKVTPLARAHAWGSCSLGQHQPSTRQ
jgi:hypothetical protein